MARHILPPPVQNLIDEFARLPGIGPKSAARLTFFLLRAANDQALEFSDALRALKEKTQLCSLCFNITEVDPCLICAADDRDRELLCVVEEPLDVLALERTEGFRGRYHVLHGALSPIEGIGPEDLKIQELLERVRSGEVQEIILATNPSMEGDATAMYLRQRLEPLGVRVTRLARGLPVGGDLEYADQSTLLRALAGRQEMD